LVWLYLLGLYISEPSLADDLSLFPVYFNLEVVTKFQIMTS